MLSISAPGADTAAIPKDNPSSVPEWLTVCGEWLYFAAEDGIHGRELWKCDSEGQCTLAADIVPGPEGSNPQKLLDAHGQLYFLAETPGEGLEAWAYNGEENQAYTLGDFCSGPQSSEPVFFGATREALYLSAVNSIQTRGLWRIPLSGLQNSMKEVDSGVRPHGMILQNGRICYYGKKGGIWEFDETTAALRDITGPFSSPSRGAPIENSGMGSLGDQILFIGWDEQSGIEPWVTDIPGGKTILLADINPGPPGSGIRQFFAHGTSLYFGADDAAHGIELWKSDGSPEGTVLVKDISPGQASSDPWAFTSVGSRLYFLADDGEHGPEVWRTDGRRDNTKMVKDLFPGPKGSGPWRLTSCQNQLFFCANHPEYGEEIWKTDGAPEGTSLVRDIVPGPAGSGPHQLTVYKEILFFTCNDGFHGEELWRTDGTPEGTTMVSDINIPKFNPSSAPRCLTPFKDNLLFVASDAKHGAELWASDGTPRGTKLLVDIWPGSGDSDPQELTVAGSRVFFTATTPTEGKELWQTDGTDTGTSIVRDIRPGLPDSTPRMLTANQETVFFAISRGDNGCELWKSDGTENGTVCMRSWEAGDRDVSITRIFPHRGSACLYVESLPGDCALWQTNGMAAGTNQLINFPVQDLQLFFECFSSKGAAALPVPQSIRTLSEDIFSMLLLYPPRQANGPTATVTIQGITYFVGYSGETGVELWETEGSAAKTRISCDIFPGRASSCPTNLCAYRDCLYFTAEHATEGRLLWSLETNENKAHPVRLIGDALTEQPLLAFEMTTFQEWLMVAAAPAREKWRENVELWVIEHVDEDRLKTALAICPGNSGSYPHSLTPVNGRVFFVADDGAHGEELWITDGTPDGTRLVKDILAPMDMSTKNL